MTDRHGYQPTDDKGTRRPPRGGSGVPPKPMSTCPRCDRSPVPEFVDSGASMRVEYIPDRSVAAPSSEIVGHRPLEPENVIITEGAPVVVFLVFLFAGFIGTVVGLILAGVGVFS